METKSPHTANGAGAGDKIGVYPRPFMTSQGASQTRYDAAYYDFMGRMNDYERAAIENRNCDFDDLEAEAEADACLDRLRQCAESLLTAKSPNVTGVIYKLQVLHLERDLEMQLDWHDYLGLAICELRGLMGNARQ